jgi:hypothetical protein
VGYGQFNEQGDLFLEAEEVPKIQKEFYQTYISRMQFEAKRKEEKLLQVSEKLKPDFKP